MLSDMTLFQLFLKVMKICVRIASYLIFQMHDSFLIQISATSQFRAVVTILASILCCDLATLNTITFLDKHFTIPALPKCMRAVVS